VLDGFHQGHTVVMEYQPTLKLLKPKVITVDYCCDPDLSFPDDGPEILEYKECFRAVDGEMVLYSTSGKSGDLFGLFEWVNTTIPRTKRTTLYFGYHNDPILRDDRDEKDLN
jgi:hypothetical protein